MAETIVQRKLSRLIQEELSQMFTLSQRGKLEVMLTVSQTKITADLSLAKVYISAFPDNKLKETVDDLNERNWEIRHALAARIKNKVRKIPDIRFYADDSFAEADKINSLIDTLEIQPGDEEDEANS